MQLIIGIAIGLLLAWLYWSGKVTEQREIFTNLMMAMSRKEKVFLVRKGLPLIHGTITDVTDSDLGPVLLVKNRFVTKVPLGEVLDVSLSPGLSSPNPEAA